MIVASGYWWLGSCGVLSRGENAGKVKSWRDGADHRPARLQGGKRRACHPNPRQSSTYGQDVPQRSPGTDPERSALATQTRGGNLFGRSWRPARTVAAAMDDEMKWRPILPGAVTRPPLSSLVSGKAVHPAKDRHWAAPAVMLQLDACQPMRFAPVRRAGLAARGGRQDFGRFTESQIAPWQRPEQRHHDHRACDHPPS